MRSATRFLTSCGAVLVGLALFTLAAPVRLEAQRPNLPQGTIEVEPIRCWWRTTTGAVRTGETFTLTLTCAVLETEAVQIVPDEARLGSSVIQMAPFEIVTGSHPADLRTDNRRFLQYDYVLRMINPDFIGHDVRIPDLSIHYRVNTKMAGDASLQGRDLVYMLPPHAVRILNLVSPDAFDIRDSSSESFATVEAMSFRASMLRIVAITLMALGALLGLVSLVRLLGMARKRGPVADHLLGDASVLATAGAELSAVQRESEGGWTDVLASRALSASRIVAGYVIGRPARQAVVDRSTIAGEGRLTRSGRRGKTIAVWSSVTGNDLVVNRTTKSLPADRKALLEPLQSALQTMTVASYARTPESNRTSMDAALGQVLEAQRAVKGDYSWLKLLLQRVTGKEAHPKERP